METIIYKIDRENIDSSVINEAGAVIRSGGLVAFPTETVYGLGGDALNTESSKKIYAAKGRPSDNPLIVHIADKNRLGEIAWDVTDKARRVIDTFWPGPLTLIFPKKEIIPCETTGGLDTVAVRMPVDGIAAAFIKAAGGFVAAPSANLSGRPSTTTAKRVAEDLAGRIEMILDGGASAIGLESTILDLSTGTPTILRPGAVTQSMLEECIGTVEVDKAIISPDSGIRPKAPGMKYRHYAPRAGLAIVEGRPADVVAAVNASVARLAAGGKKAGVIATDETAPLYEGAVVRSLGRRDDEAEVASHLFEVLRGFDDTDVDFIFSESFEEQEIGAAIMNRLLKAAGHRVIRV